MRTNEVQSVKDHGLSARSRKRDHAASKTGGSSKHSLEGGRIENRASRRGRDVMPTRLEPDCGNGLVEHAVALRTSRKTSESGPFLILQEGGRGPMVSILLVESATRKLVSAKACFISAPSVQEPIKSARVRGAQVEHDRQVVEWIVLQGSTRSLRGPH